MTTDDELVERLRRMKHKFVVPRDVAHEYGLFDEAADRISLLREALEGVGCLLGSVSEWLSHPEVHTKVGYPGAVALRIKVDRARQALASSGGGG